MIAIRSFRDAENEIRRLRTEIDNIKVGSQAKINKVVQALSPEQMNVILQYVINNIKQYITTSGLRDFYVVMGFGGDLETGILGNRWPWKIVIDPTTKVKWIEAIAQVISAPVGADLIFDVQWSADGGETYNSMFLSADEDKLVVADGAYSGSQIAFELTEGFNDFLPQVEVLSVGSETSGGYACIILRGTIENI